MDYQNRAGSKTGGGGVASSSAANVDRRERQRRLAAETIDLDKDPYFFRNHVGKIECRLCMNTHQNEGSYLAHTQAARHQKALAYRAHRDEKEREREGNNDSGGSIGGGFGGVAKKSFVPIGTPQFTIEKYRDPLTRQTGLRIQLSFPQIAPGVTPMHCWLSSYQQTQETPYVNTMYLVIAAEPYQNSCIKINRSDLDISSERALDFWDPDTKQYWVQFCYKSADQQRLANVPGLASGGRTGK